MQTSTELPRLRILWVKALKLLPVDTGSKIRSFYILRALAERHDVTVLTYYDGRPDASYLSEMKKLFDTPVTLSVRLRGATRATRPFGFLATLLRSEPYQVTKFESPPVRDWLSSGLTPQRFDVAVCDFLAPSLNFPKVSLVPTVLFQHNVESVLWARKALTTQRILNRCAFGFEARRLATFEAVTVRAFDHVIAVSAADRLAMLPMATPDHFTVVPTGVDVRQYQSLVGLGGFGKEVVFIGSMDWEPNIDGILWFCRDVWPIIVETHPDARLTIVGRNPPQSVVVLRSEAIEVTGRVDEVTPYLERASVVIVPLLAGGGTRLKIYEAMAAGRAVVSTTVGAEGLDVQQDRDILLADEQTSFAASVSRLLSHVEERARIGRAAAVTAGRFDWSEVTHDFERALRTAISQKKALNATASGADTSNTGLLTNPLIQSRSG